MRMACRGRDMCGWGAHRGVLSPTTRALLFILLYFVVCHLVGGRRGGHLSKGKFWITTATRTIITGNPKFPLAARQPFIQRLLVGKPWCPNTIPKCTLHFGTPPWKAWLAKVLTDQ